MGKVAPHEGRELSLLLDGAKDFAVIEKRNNARDYYAALNMTQPGIVSAFRFGLEGAEVVLTRDAAKLAEYDGLVYDGVKRLGIKQYHRAMGRLFGYSADDIEAFIDSDIDCDCSKCKGVN